MTREHYPAGWGKSPASPKWHYFPEDNGFSLCGKVGFYFGVRDPQDDDHAKNCAACKKKLVTMRKKAQPVNP